MARGKVRRIYLQWHLNATIHEHHYGWDNSLAPAVRIAPGESLEFEVADASGGQLSPASTVDDVGRLDFGRINPVSGPVYIDGAEPGDILKVTVLSFAPSGWGWTANIPGFGLLAEEFKEPALHLWRYDDQTLAPPRSAHGRRVPLKPFAGTIGVAPAEPGCHSIVPPRRVGGNMDCGTSQRKRAASAGRGRGRALFRGRHACGAGGRRGLRHGVGKSHARGAAVRPREAESARFSAADHSRPGHPSPR